MTEIFPAQFKNQMLLTLQNSVLYMNIYSLFSDHSVGVSGGFICSNSQPHLPAVTPG